MGFLLNGFWVTVSANIVTPFLIGGHARVWTLQSQCLSLSLQPSLKVDVLSPIKPLVLFKPLLNQPSKSLAYTVAPFRLIPQNTTQIALPKTTERLLSTGNIFFPMSPLVPLFRRTQSSACTVGAWVKKMRLHSQSPHHETD